MTNWTGARWLEVVSGDDWPAFKEKLEKAGFNVRGRSNGVPDFYDIMNSAQWDRVESLALNPDQKITKSKEAPEQESPKKKRGRRKKGGK
jgi:hypothetical protein